MAEPGKRREVGVGHGENISYYDTNRNAETVSWYSGGCR
jgi:hypothetical protein